MRNESHEDRDSRPRRRRFSQWLFFYEAQQKGLGSYFLDSLYSDIDSLHLYGGLHQNVYKVYHRLLSRRFPFAIFYTIKEDSLLIYAVLDCRSDPAWIRDRLEK